MNILITAGGTSEAIDAVRKITNISTGALAKKIYEVMTSEFQKSGIPLHVDYLASTTALLPELSPKDRLHLTTDTHSVEVALHRLLANHKIDVMIHCMAVSDYYVSKVQRDDQLANDLLEMIQASYETNTIITIEDIKATLQSDTSNQLERNYKISSKKDLFVRLSQTPKLISQVKVISPSTRLIGFKLLNNVTKQRLVDVATDMANLNDCELVVANDLTHIGTHKHLAFILKNGQTIETCQSKTEIAVALTNYLIHQS